MITTISTNDIFATKNKHVAFAITHEGVNDPLFAQTITRMFWSELGDRGALEFGTVLSKTADDGKIYHALVCYSSQKDGWGIIYQEEMIKRCFNNIILDEDEKDAEISTIAIGAGLSAQLAGANLSAIFRGMDKSEKKIDLHLPVREGSLEELREIIYGDEK